MPRNIDAVVNDRPVWLRRIDGHAGWANSAAMKLAGNRCRHAGSGRREDHSGRQWPCHRCFH